MLVLPSSLKSMIFDVVTTWLLSHPLSAPVMPTANTAEPESRKKSLLLRFFMLIFLLFFIFRKCPDTHRTLLL